MGRPEPCVLYAHTFVHPQLDEHVDEVLFSEPVVITACEFLEQNASSLCPAVTLIGATSPPSFALEVFIQCKGETRFRRLCQPCLYSHSASNVLEVEAVVTTSHLVVRGSYRSLSMVIYGNTAEDLGQFNIEVGLDSTLTETVDAVEGSLEDLPPAFRPTDMAIEELESPLKLFSQSFVPLDISLELRQFLLLVFKVLDSEDRVAADKVLSSLLSLASCNAATISSHKTVYRNQGEVDELVCGGNARHVLAEVQKELSEIYKTLQNVSGDPSAESLAESMFPGSEAGSTSKDLVETLHQRFDFCNIAENVGYAHLSQKKNIVLWLSLAWLLCSARKSCFHFVNRGGMVQLVNAFTPQRPNSTALRLMLLGVIEQATRHSFGCEGFLGWWPREDANVPPGTSEGYNQLLKLLLGSQRHDVPSLATYILQRLRFYEVACRFEGAVLSILEGVSAVGRVTDFTLDILASAKLQLKTLLKLIKMSGPIDDPSPVASASRFFILGDAGQLAYKTTRGLLNQSNCSFSNWDIDSHSLSLLKERGFLPLLAALLSSPNLRSESAMDLLLDAVSYIEAIILSLLFCRSGLDFLLHDPEVYSTFTLALRGIGVIQKEESVSLRYASVLISKGFFCRPKEVSMIIEMHMRALIAIDSLCNLTPNTEEFLWVLWDLCRLSRSECGRQALLVLVNFPEALAVLITTLHSGREFNPVSLNSGISPLNLAIFHAAAEIFEVVVTDSIATSLTSWIDHAKELHLALYSSSPGSNKKDAPARLLEWIDGGVVYHKNGVIGLLRYAAVLASGGDAHMTSNSILASDMVDVENVVGDFSNSDGNVVDTLIGKRITEKDFPGVVLRDSSISQLTTAFRILAFLSDDSVAAAALYDEGAVMVIHAVMINCKLMLERSSNIYDYLVDEGTESNSTSDLLLERNRKKSLFDLLIPSLVLLINLLQKLQETKEQHRNTKLMNVLLQLHREVSPRLAACAADLYHTCPDFVLVFGAVCHLLASALACWPLYSWTPGLFHHLLEGLHATSLLALGPKEICGLFCLLIDLLPEESICMWKNGIPMLSAVRSLAVGTLLGPQKEKQINWYLRPGHPQKLVAQLSPNIPKLGEIILHCAISISVAVQDIIRLFIIRIARVNIQSASLLLRPIITWISHHLSQPSISDVDSYKVQQLLDFLCMLMEHPIAKPLLVKEGGFELLKKVLERCIRDANPKNISTEKLDLSVLSWCVPVFKSVSLICDGRASMNDTAVHERNARDYFTGEELFLFWSYLLRFCMVLPVGKELFACLSTFKELVSYAEGQKALLSFFMHIQSSTTEACESQIEYDSDAKSNVITASEWKERAPLLCCWATLLKSVNLKDVPTVQVAAAIDMLSSGSLAFCMDGECLNLEKVAVVKFFFGVKREDSLEGFVEDSLKRIDELTNLLGSETSSEALPDNPPSLYQVKETVNLLLLLLQKSSRTEEDAKIVSGYTSLRKPPVSSKLHTIALRNMEQTEDHEFEAKFSWDCPENLRDRLKQSGFPGKRNLSSLGGQNRHSRGDNPVPEAAAQSTFSRASAQVTTSTGLSRRDTFRQRKPNSSRPPSLHVDDYVARERNADGTSAYNSSSNVIAAPLIGSATGRPPSIHVDKFMARQQKDHQSVVGMSSSNAAAAAAQPKPNQNNIDVEKSSKSQPLKPELDDDLQGIDIVFDAEESETDDKLPFPKPDDNLLQQPTASVEQQRSPHSVVAETDIDVNESSLFSRLGTPLATNVDENTTVSEFSSRMSASRPLNREPSISSAKKFPDQSDDKSFLNRTAAIDTSSALSTNSGVSGSGYMNNIQFPPFDSRVPPNLYPKTNLQQRGAMPPPLGTTGGYYNQKFASYHQPPLPPMPPPPTVSSVLDSVVSQPSSSFVKSQADMQQQPHGFHVQSEYMSAGSSPGGGYARPPPPLPPTPPPYSKNNSTSSQSQQYFQNSSDFQQTTPIPQPTLTSYPMMPPLMQPMLFRPGGSMPPPSLYGNSIVSSHQGGDNLSLPSVASQNLPISLTPIHSNIPNLTQLQPLQPPQIPRRPHQYLRPQVPASPQTDPSPSLLQGGSMQMPAQVLQQQTQVNVFQQSLQQQQDPSGMSLQDFFRSPEAIQSLLSDRDKLCELLEQHPKLIQMLQERLGQF